MLQREIFPWRELVKLELGEPQRVSSLKHSLCLDSELNLAPAVGISALPCELPQPQGIGGRERKRSKRKTGWRSWVSKYTQWHSADAIRKIRKWSWNGQSPFLSLILCAGLRLAPEPPSSLISLAFSFASVLFSYKTAAQAHCPLPSRVCLRGLTYEFQGLLEGWQVMKQYVQCELKLGKQSRAFLLCTDVCAQISD